MPNIIIHPTRSNDADHEQRPLRAGDDARKLYWKPEVAIVDLMVAVSDADNPQKRPIQVLLLQSRTK